MKIYTIEKTSEGCTSVLAETPEEAVQYIRDDTTNPYAYLWSCYPDAAIIASFKVTPFKGCGVLSNIDYY